MNHLTSMTTPALDIPELDQGHTRTVAVYGPSYGDAMASVGIGVATMLKGLNVRISAFAATVPRISAVYRSMNRLSPDRPPKYLLRFDIDGVQWIRPLNTADGVDGQLRRLLGTLRKHEAYQLERRSHDPTI